MFIHHFEARVAPKARQRSHNPALNANRTSAWSDVAQQAFRWRLPRVSTSRARFLRVGIAHIARWSGTIVDVRARDAVASNAPRRG
jgi:hypothetical protein